MMMRRNSHQLAAWQSSEIDSQNDCVPDDVPQYFRVIVSVIKGKRLLWEYPNSATSYVIVVLDKIKQRTRVKRNMPEPCYRETFEFEVCACMKDLHRAVLRFAVMESKCCFTPRLLGDASVDLAVVWFQPHHTMCQKWAQLTLPKDNGVGPAGFLKVDISIRLRGEEQILTTRTSDEKIEDCLLLPSGSEQQLAGYQITIYGGYSLSSSPQCNAEKFAKPPSTFVKAKTAVHNRNSNPMYSEQICMVEMFPNICQTVKLEVCCADVNNQKVLASTCLGLAQISHGVENGFLPTFGPAFLYMYGSWSSSSQAFSGDGPYFRGALLLSLKTVVPYCKQPLRAICVESVAPLKPETVWTFEDFCIYCAIFEVSMLDKRISVKPCGVAITMGEVPCDDFSDEEFVTLLHEIQQHKLHYTGAMEVHRNQTPYGSLDFEDGLPVLQLAKRLPDFRIRMYRNNMVHRIVEDLECVLNHVDCRLQANDFDSPNQLMSLLHCSLENAATGIQKFLSITGCPSDETKNMTTELDVKQMHLQNEELEKICQRITKKATGASAFSLACKVRGDGECNKKAVKSLLAEAKATAQDLRGLIFKRPDGWPDIVVWQLSGGSRVAYTKVLCADILHSDTPEQNGRKCGRIQTVYLKPVKCSKHLNSYSCNCIAAKVELLFWMGSFSQRGAFEPCLPTGYLLRARDCSLLLKCCVMSLECRVNVFRAKLSLETDCAAAMCVFVRVNFMTVSKDTQVQQNSVNPVWNEIAKFNLNVYTTPHRLTDYPPEILVEVFGFTPTTNQELIGRVSVEPTIHNQEGLPPRLKWLDILCGSEQTGQILVSAQLFQSPERNFKTAPYVDQCNNVVITNEEHVSLEPIPHHLIPEANTYKVDVYWWGLREVSITHKPCMVLEILDVSIKSGIISHATTNCNFPRGRISQIFEGNLTDCWCTPLLVKLYESGSFGRTLFLGLNVVKNPLKYMIEWIPKKERQESIYSTMIRSPDFVQVGQKIYVKNAQDKINDSDSSFETYQEPCKRNILPKVFYFRELFAKETDEEKHMLLPMFSKKNNRIEVVQKNSEEEPAVRDWWTRYIESQTDNSNSEKRCADLLIIYNSELEFQPGFSRFKDWCSTLKLYNGKKTGIPEKDEQLHCGYIKLGIKIYRWPPPRNTVAVSPNGVQLDRGFYSDYPENESILYLVRVYVVKAFGLVSKDCASKADPYVTIQCGKQLLGDRKSYVQKSNCPVFGEMYELRCTLPKEYLLKVSLSNFNPVWPDDLIGCTLIDLEDRAFSKHRPSVGLATVYTRSGPTKWRDNQKPSVILEELCLKNHLPPPVFPDSDTVLVSGVEYSEYGAKGPSAERKENICLNLLHKWYTLPICGHKLVPEHVETRALYNPEKPGVVQGKIHLWVDMFRLEHGVHMPAPVDITPRRVEEYELRVVIWDVLEVQLQGASDIYVKGWIGPSDEAQDTDIHYKSDGEGHFNWRMIFHFIYQHANKKLVLNDKGPFTEVEEHFPPILVVQVQDSESPSPRAFLATLMFDITDMPAGAKCEQQCTPDIIQGRKINLFLVKSTRAWWPLKMLDRNTGCYYPGGKIDLELTLLPLEKAILMPVGIGRCSPLPLPNPKRKNSAQPFKMPLRLPLSFVYGTLFLVVMCIVLWIYSASASDIYWTDEIDEIEAAIPTCLLKRLHILAAWIYWYGSVGTEYGRLLLEKCG